MKINKERLAWSCAISSAKLAIAGITGVNIPYYLILGGYSFYELYTQKNFPNLELNKLKWYPLYTALALSGIYTLGFQPLDLGSNSYYELHKFFLTISALSTAQCYVGLSVVNYITDRITKTINNFRATNDKENTEGISL